MIESYAPPLIICFSLKATMDTSCRVTGNYLTMPKQSMGMYNQFHLTHFNMYHHVSVLGLGIIYVS